MADEVKIEQVDRIEAVGAGASAWHPHSFNEILRHNILAGHLDSHRLVREAAERRIAAAASEQQGDEPA